MKRTPQIGVRLSAPERQRLDRISKRIGLSKSDLVRHALDAFIPEIEESGGLTIQFSRKRRKNRKPEGAAKP